jgi:hypothetical protein
MCGNRGGAMETDFNNKPTFSFKELLLCLGLIVLGCVCFYFMPENMGILGWILFAIGTFLNVVGIFRLAATVLDLKSSQARRIVSITAIAAAVIIQIIGLVYLYSSFGTVKGIAITTLTLCISLGLIFLVVDFDDEKIKKKIVIACRVITVILIAIAIFLVLRDDFSKTSIYVGTILLIEAVITGNIGLPRKK